MNYEEAIKYIKNTSKFSMKLGLERTEKILQLLGSPEKKLKYIHVAGTNGKGSTTAMISQILIEAGYKVGMYISPYLEEFEERIQINNSNILKDELCASVEEVKNAIEKAKLLGFDNPTEFEIITCVMFNYFYKNSVDYAVIEVGLGGRLDSTNVLSPLLTVITSLSLDHMAILGDTIDKIAYEKAGIIKQGVPLVLYPQDEKAYEVIRNKCIANNCEIINVNPNCYQFVSNDTFGQIIKINTSTDNYEVKLALLGEYQILNSAVAIYAAEELIKLGANITKQNIYDGLKNVKWPGRFEILLREPMVVIDGAHNVDGMQKLVRSVKSYLKYDKIVLILGILADKQVHEMVNQIVPLSNHVITVTPHSERAELSSELYNIVNRYNSSCETIEDYHQAYLKAKQLCNENSLLLISGSLYMIGDMRKIIRKEENID